MTTKEQQQLLETLHDQAKSGGLAVRYWDLRHGCLVVSLRPDDGKKETKKAGSAATGTGDPAGTGEQSDVPDGEDRREG